MTHASLCSGIGGFDLAAEWVGWKNLFNCEIDAFCRRILNAHFKEAKQYENLKTTDFRLWRGKIDVLSAGFPCQPYSSAGKRLGTDDSRDLWSEVLRTIREVRPRWFVGENVLGIIDWSNGLVFENICSDLENEGYEVVPYILPACSVGALHRRYRVFFIAHTECFRLSPTTILCRTKQNEQVQYESEMPSFEVIKAHDFRSKSDKHGVIDGIPVGLDECSLHAYGNAIVPQVALRIFNAINDYESDTKI